MKSHHILIASEQLWPNLLGLAALEKRDDGWVALHILHTESEDYSKKPAKALAGLAKQIFDAPVELHLTGAHSEEVTKSIHQLLQTQPPDTQWTINATGGTKLMFAGVIPWVSKENIEVFYREIQGDWFRLLTSSIDQIQTTRCEKWNIDEPISVNLSVEKLVTTPNIHPEDTRWKSNPVTAIENLHKIVKQGIEYQWDWNKLQNEFPVLANPQSKNSGFVFEKFFGGLLKLCGANNIIANLESKQGSQVSQEFDAIVSTGEQIIVFDLKLQKEDTNTIDQLSRLSSDRRKLGGLNAKAIAVRPTWPKDALIQKIAKSLNVEIWTQEEMGDIISKLCKLFETNISDHLSREAIHQLLKQQQNSGERLFTQSDFIEKHPELTEVKIGHVNLSVYKEECKHLNQSTTILELEGRTLIRTSNSHPVCRDQNTLLNALRNFNLTAFVKILFYQQTKKSRIILLFLHDSTKRQEFDRFLDTLLK